MIFEVRLTMYRTWLFPFSTVKQPLRTSVPSGLDPYSSPHPNRFYAGCKTATASLQRAEAPAEGGRARWAGGLLERQGAQDSDAGSGPPGRRGNASVRAPSLIAG